jgi:hypothetical protein
MATSGVLQKPRGRKIRPVESVMPWPCRPPQNGMPLRESVVAGGNGGEPVFAKVLPPSRLRPHQEPSIWLTQ